MRMVGRVLRSPHAHAIIKKIDISKAEKLPGVKAIVTRDDFPDLPKAKPPFGPIINDPYDMTRNMMAREKALYEGHPVAAVAAVSDSVAKKALKLIKVDYKVLPHVIDPVEAMKPGAPILHEDQTTFGTDSKTPSNVFRIMSAEKGSVADGFKKADKIVERTFNTAATHQGYIEPHACVANASEDGYIELWTSTQGQWVDRGTCCELLGIPEARVRVTASEIGGGFGGKIPIYNEPLAMRLSQKARRPVRMVMTRDEVFRASGPTSGANVWVKVGAKKDGTITAAEDEVRYQAGAFKGSPVAAALNCMFSNYDLENVKVTGYDVCVNRPKAAAYRAPGVPMAAFGGESVMNEMAKVLGMDPVDFRMKNAAKQGTKNLIGVTYGPVGYIDVLKAVKDHPHYKAPLGRNQGRGFAVGYWMHAGGPSCATLNAQNDGTVTLVEGNPDIGGSRASMCAMAAETLGIPYEKVRPIIADTSSLGFTFLTGGSRTTYATGMAVVQAAESLIKRACERAAQIWGVTPAEVVWEEGMARPASSNVGEFEPLSLAQLAQKFMVMDGALSGHAEINAQGQGPAMGAHLVDVEVDPETGHVTPLRYTVFQDVGRAISPDYVEGQLQGGAVQGIGWALNEEYIYNKDGKLENAGFLDYRIPVASDVPMIDTVMIECPNPNHPYGVRGVGETPIVPPLAAVANAVANACDIIVDEVPFSPPKILHALAAKKMPKAAE